MDFAKLDTKTPAENGAFLHLRHPSLGHLLYNGKGCDEHNDWKDKKKDASKVGVIVRGVESESVQNHAKKLDAQRIKNTNGKRKAPGGEVERTAEEIEQEALDFCVSLVVGFVGFEKDGKEIVADENTKYAFFTSSNNLIEQVVDFAKDHQFAFTSAPSA